MNWKILILNITIVLTAILLPEYLDRGFLKTFCYVVQGMFMGYGVYYRAKIEYPDEDADKITRFIIDKVRGPLKELVKHEAEYGNVDTLPAEFKTDPAAWLLILQKMEFAFEHEWLKEYDWDGHEETAEHEELVRDGFELFGKYFRVMKIRK